MNEEYIVVKIMHNFNVGYDFAVSLFHDLEDRGLLDDYKLNINKIETYEDFHERYYGSISNK